MCLLHITAAHGLVVKVALFYKGFKLCTPNLHNGWLGYTHQKNECSYADNYILQRLKFLRSTAAMVTTVTSQ